MFKDILLGNDDRLIVVSDIHGNLEVFKKLLKKANFDVDNDILIIVGDILEKGPHILETLRFVMNLTKTSNTHVILGNCDTILMDIAENQFHDEIKEYLLTTNNKSVLFEMCKEIDFKIAVDMDIADLYDRLHQNFREEISFIANLPIMIETEEFIFVHGGIEPREDYRNSDYDYLIRHDRFYEIDFKFPKKVVVGHWSTSLYHDDTFDVSPIIDHDKNIICIDGGNSICPFGQLNALIVENHDISYVSADMLPKANVIKNQLGTKGQKIIWPYDEAEIVTESENYYSCHLKSYSKRGYTPENIEKDMIDIPKNLIYEQNGKFYTHQFMNEMLDLKIGDSVKIVLDNNAPIVICKFNGKVGLVQRDVLNIL